MRQKKVLVIAGPTGVGESTITKKIVKQYPVFTRLVTATTRRPRLNEKNKKDYYFFSINKFKDEIKKGNIIEYTFVKNRGVYYGSYKYDLENKLKKGYNVIVNPDIIGAKYYKKNYNAATIFIKPDSLANLKKRQLVRNKKISKDELSKRMDYAKQEINNEALFYSYTVINKQGELSNAVNEVIKIIKIEGYCLK